MKTTSAIKSLRLDSLLENSKYAVCSFFSFLVSNVHVLGTLSPFGVALSTALPLKFSISSVIGAILGYSLLGDFVENFPYLIALFIIMGIKSAISEIPKIRTNPIFLSTLSSTVLAFCLIVKNLTLNRGTVDLIFCLCESILGGSLTFFTYIAFKAISSKKKFADTNTIEKSSLMIITLIGLLGFCQISFFSLNLGRILTVLLLLIITNKKGMSYGAVIGLFFSAVLALFSQSFTVSAGIFALSAMLSGYFVVFGKLTQVAFFILTYTVGTLVTGADFATVTGAFDMLLGCSVFMILPKKWLDKIPSSRPFQPSNRKETNRTCAKLNFASKTLEDMHNTVDAVSQKLKNSGIKNISAIYDKTSEEICRRCGLKMFCWESNYNQTFDAFHKLSNILEENGKITTDDLSAHLYTQCVKPKEIVDSINNYYYKYLSNKNATRKIMNAKQVASEQLEGIAQMLYEMSEEIAETTSLNPKLSQIAYDIFLEAGEDCEEVYYIIDKYDRVRLEVYKTSPLKTDLKLITERLSDSLERNFDTPSIVRAENLTKISFFEQAKYTLEFAVGQLNSKNQKISGDCYEYFTDSRGFAHLILSDGMGNGGRAAVDSIMACNFILKLLKAGFGFNAALKLINSALLVKAGDESLATLDIGCIDLYTGNTQFLKAGASVSFVTRNKKTVMVGSNSLPMGILQGITYDKSEIKLQNGDLVVMVTDGAISVNPEWLQEEITLLSDLPPRKIATKIATLAKQRNGENEDDITVLVAKIIPAR